MRKRYKSLYKEGVYRFAVPYADRQATVKYLDRNRYDYDVGNSMIINSGAMFEIDGVAREDFMWLMKDLRTHKIRVKEE